MPDEIWLHVLGLTAKVTLDDKQLAAEVRRAWSACLLDTSAAVPDLVIEPDRTDSQVEVRGASGASKPQDDLAAGLEHLTQALTVTAIEALAGQRLMLHACAVARGDRSVVLVGPSGMGKTTVATVLGRRWSYVTDECVSVAGDGRVTPFPKPLSVIGAGPAKTQVAPTELGLTPCAERTTPAGLVLLRRDPGAGEPTVERVSTARAVALLAEHTSYLTQLERPLARVADLVHAVGGLQVVTYAEAVHLAPLVEEHLGVEA
ncbi:hypothetical protein [Nocardioides marmoribigeumensis]|uniref:AAA+ ATPase domain-containing protein n=1 Tax=Nocardioides marmoribigeumensis TaxID=433649 RepID=A0ABU2BTP9_9ACTN|nr:hypothetical protein [Nocardioides marmoribigeumensis]MDR7362000.1 hypothetical protein [Nocardioides marmoribigeumensis]